MKLRNALMISGAIGMAMASTSADGPRRDGKWEVKIEMQMPGMTMPPQTTTQCLTKEDAADPQKAMPQGGRGMQGNCKISDFKVDGNKVSWSMTCENKMTGKSEFVYAGETYTGTMKMNMEAQEMMTMKLSGKRLGDCTK